MEQLVDPDDAEVIVSLLRSRLPEYEALLGRYNDAVFPVGNPRNPLPEKELKELENEVFFLMARYGDWEGRI